MEKKKLRETIKAKIHALQVNEKIESENKLSINIQNFLDSNFIGFKSIGLYWPLRDEYNLSDVDFSRWQICVPEIDNDQMNYKLIDLVEFRDSKKGYRNKIKGSVFIPEILIIPGLAFDQSGYRLGRGGGFFDKYLSNYQGVKVGVCGEFQVIETVHPQQHDIKMDYIITDNQIYKL